MGDASTEDRAGAPGRWYFQEWLATLGKRQADIVRTTGWPKGRVSQLANSKRAVTLTVIHEVADALGIAAHELLMPPLEAMALRRLRESALSIAADRPGVHRPPATKRGN